MRSALSLGSYWCGFLLAYSTLAAPQLQRISFDDLARSYYEQGELRFGSDWNPADDSMTAILEEWVKMVPNFEPPFYSVDSLYFSFHPLGVGGQVSFTGIPVTLAYVPSVVVDTNSVAVDDDGLYFATNFVWYSEGIAIDSWGQLASVLAENTVSTDGKMHSFLALRPFVEIARSGIVPPASALQTLHISWGSQYPTNCYILAQLLHPGTWDLLAGYSLPEFHLSQRLRPSELYLSSYSVPFYPGPVWYNALHDPSVYLRYSDMIDFLACLADAGVDLTPPQKMRGMAFAWDGVNSVALQSHYNLRLVWRGDENE